MIKKYVLIIAVLLVILMFTSTSTASVVSPSERMYELLQKKFQGNIVGDNIYNKLASFISSSDDGVPDDVDDEDDGDVDDEDDGDEDDVDGDIDDGEPDDLFIPDGPMLPKVWDPDFYGTHDDGNEPVDETSNTIDHPNGDDGGVVWNNGTIDSDDDGGTASNETTIPDYIDKGEWTVKLERFVEIVTDHNKQLGGMLQIVIERTFAPGTTESDGTAAENGIVGVVVEGGPSVVDGAPGAGDDNADVVVLTNDG